MHELMVKSVTEVGLAGTDGAIGRFKRKKSPWPSPQCKEAQPRGALLQHLPSSVSEQVIASAVDDWRIGP